MRNPLLLFLTLVLCVCISGCKKKEAASSDQVRALLSHRSLGLAFLEENQLDQAGKEFRKIIELAPAEAFGHANLALATLRKGHHGEAEKHARKALEFSQEPEVVLILAEILERSGKPESAIQELRRSVKTYPQHVPSQYKLAQMTLRSTDSDRYQKAEISLSAILSAAPANLPARLYLAETFVRNDKPKQAIEQLREIRQLVAVLPPGAERYQEATLNALTASNSVESLSSLIAFHNFLKPTPVYQAGIVELSGPGGALMGFPVTHFSSRISHQVQSKPLEYIRFVAAGTTAAPAVRRIEADYDNDGRSEACEIRDTALILIDDNGKVVYEARGKFSGALFFDFDQDGDLDLYTVGEARALRNNGDGTFSDNTQTMSLRRSGRSTDAVFGDFDDDGDLDLFVVDPASGNNLYDNLREGRFREITKSAGLTGFSNAVTTADYDSDGFLDLFAAGKRSFLFRNSGDGRFEPDKRSGDFSKLNARAANFLDFDNDGLQDLSIATDKLILYRNMGRGRIEVASSILPSVQNVTAIGDTDGDSDGDLDMRVTDSSGRVHSLRNDGGNANRWLKVTLVGLGTGSGKNNRNGIGAKLEIKAGDLYQMQVVTDPIMHFGLGSRKSADVLRVVWTNGVPQNHVQPQSNQVLAEKQILKGSCPFVYAWNGARYEFVTDIMWKSALGMPLGIMAASTAYAFPNSSDEYLRIAGERLKARDGFYSIQVTEELWETAYLDQMRLVAVDHPKDVEIYIDEKFVVPPFPPLRVYPVSHKIYPRSAIDHNGLDVLGKLRAKDDEYVANLKPARYQGTTENHALTLDLGSFGARDQVTLFLRGWIFPSDASINVAISQSNAFKAKPPSLQMVDRNGKWQTVLPSMSFPMGKDKTMIVDLAGKFLSADRRIRIETSMEIYWDEIFYTKNEPAVSMRLTELKPAHADLHYRGFSAMYRKNVLGPHWFDYSNVDKSPKWRDLEGHYTRFGDVTPLLQKSDSMFVILNAGDEITIRFDEKLAPAPGDGWRRDFLLYSDGWIKDGDLNTAHSKSVEPLPFQGIHSYPYSSKDQYPDDAAHREYLKTYNTRVVKPKLRM